MRSVLILGAGSDIGLAVAHCYAARGHPIQLAARNVQRLEVDKADLELRYQIAVSLLEFDALDVSAHRPWVDELAELPQIVVCAVGLMGDQAQSESDPDAASVVVRSNFEGPASILSIFANRLQARGPGTLVGISSVAGERGRATNYMYGSAKAGFTAFLSGLRNRLSESGVHVVTVLPGFVNTRMTEGMDLPRRLTVEPDQVARAIVRAVENRRDVIYVGWKWRWIMLVIRAIPERVFKRLRL